MIRKNISIPEEIDAQIKSYCKSMNMTYTAFLILASSEYLKKDIINERFTKLFFNAFTKSQDGKDTKTEN